MSYDETTIFMTKQASSAIEQLLAQGQLEPALEQLLALLDRDPQGGELAQIARVNQADLYQLKAAVLKGTIAPDEERLIRNRLTDSALQIVRRAAEGKFSFTEPEAQPARSQVWRYYLAGGIVALAGALLAWRLLGGSPKTADESCPTFSEQARYRVMVLPFKQTGEKKASQPEIDIADGLNVLISKTPGLKNIAEADVHEGYDIEKEYPNFAQAADIAEGCGAQMLVWGKINQDEQNEYKLDVRYKIIGSGGVQTGDTTLGNLLKMREEGRNLVQDVEAVTRLVYIVLANHVGVGVLPSFIASAAPADSSASAASEALPDTTLLLGLAQNHALRRETDQAIATYTQVLEAFPDNQEARVKRGSLLYKKGDFAAAARDLEAAAPDAQSAQPEVLKLRIDARLQSSQPSKARDDLNSLREKTAKSDADGTWLDNKGRQVNDSLLALQRARDRMERLAQAKPQDSRLRTGAAKANLGLGDTERAIQYADKAIRQNPRDAEAVEVAVEARLQKGDTVSARKVIENAERAGAAKSVERWKGVIQQMPSPTVKQRQKQR
jgi:Flp pilus assembly protein TadD